MTPRVLDAPRPTTGRSELLVRRVAALGTAVYFGWYVVGLVRDGRRMPLGDVTRASASWAWLEIALIALVTFHATSSLSIWILERAQAARHHRAAFAISVVLALVVASLHAVLLLRLP